MAKQAGSDALSSETMTKRLRQLLRSSSEEQHANAAVALVLRVADRKPQVLFVKRTERSSDPWSGQMAMPGGKRHCSDRNLMQTVIRETMEETGINLQHCCSFLGVMEAVQSVNMAVRVLPFVFFLNDEPAIKLNKNELEEYFWTPLEELDRHKGLATLSHRKFPAYIINERPIWGMTYRFVTDFLDLFRKIT